MTTPLAQVPLFTPGVPLPAAGTADVHAISIPARAFTGDFWFTHRSADRLWFALGDVAGKGLPAALVMAMIQEELEHRLTSCARAGCDPAVTMQRLHAFLKPLLPQNRFATAVIGVLADDGALKLVNAGHCPPLIVRSGARVEQIASTGPVIGVLPSSQWHSATTFLGSGEMLILYSDGVVEATCVDGSEFGIAGIESALASESRSSSRAVAESIVAAVNRHSGSAREDDLTILAIRR